MEYQIDYKYKNGAADFNKAFDHIDLAGAILDIDWSEIESVTVYPWKD